MAKSTSKRAKALAALVEADSFTGAATAAGLSRKTIYNYMHEDSEFLRAYQRQLGEQAIVAAEQLAGERQAAIETIKIIMGDRTQPGAVRLKAAAQLLNAAAEAQARVDQGVNRIANRQDLEAKDPWSLL